MRFYGNRTAEEQSRRLPLQLREAYLNSQLDRITLFDGLNEITLTGYAEYSYLEEKSYTTQPVRQIDGAIHDIEEYATFLTPRLIIKYNMMNIDDYRALMKMLKGRNSFVIKCYDVVEDKIVRKEMYVATPSMPIIYQQYLIALGIREYAIELIGTNATTPFTIWFDGVQSTSYFGETLAEYLDRNYPDDWKRTVTQYGEGAIVGSGYLVMLGDKSAPTDDYIRIGGNYSLLSI